MCVTFVTSCLMSCLLIYFCHVCRAHTNHVCLALTSLCMKIDCLYPQKSHSARSEHGRKRKCKYCGLVGSLSTVRGYVLMRMGHAQTARERHVDALSIQILDVSVRNQIWAVHRYVSSANRQRPRVSRLAQPALACLYMHRKLSSRSRL